MLFHVFAAFATTLVYTKTKPITPTSSDLCHKRVNKQTQKIKRLKLNVVFSDQEIYGISAKPYSFSASWTWALFGLFNCYCCGIVLGKMQHIELQIIS